MLSPQLKLRQKLLIAHMRTPPRSLRRWLQLAWRQSLLRALLLCEQRLRLQRRREQRLRLQRREQRLRLQRRREQRLRLLLTLAGLLRRARLQPLLFVPSQWRGCCGGCLRVSSLAAFRRLESAPSLSRELAEQRLRGGALLLPRDASHGNLPPTVAPAQLW